MLIKRISQEKRKPVFEILTWPYDELLIQQVFFSIDDSETETTEPAEITEAEHIAAMQGIFK